MLRLVTHYTSGVHFTPEFFDSLDWKEHGHEIFLGYFHTDDQTIERSALTLAATHGTILKVFDRCFDGGISQDTQMLAAVVRFWATAKRFSDDYRARYGGRDAPVTEP